MCLDRAMVRSSLLGGVGALLPLCDERRLSVTSGRRRGAGGSLSSGNRGRLDVLCADREGLVEATSVAMLLTVLVSAELSE
jgi:hypothetical protein